MSTATPFPKPSFISVNGVVLEVFEAGQEHAGNPIVLCHGWPEHAYSWRHQMSALSAAGYHVIVPNQRGYGNSSSPVEITSYDIEHLTGDLVALLDHYGYTDAVFVGHDWGAMVVWGLALLHPARVRKVINLSLPYQERGDMPWIDLLEQVLGSDYYLVHFNRQPGVADAILDANGPRFLRNLYRKNIPLVPPEPGMAMINLAKAEAPVGDPVMSDDDLAVYVSAFERSGFAGGINWYRNLNRNWHLLGEVDPIVRQPALMVYGEQDVIPRFERLKHFVPKADVVTLECGHWMQEEQPDETSRAIIEWLDTTSSV